MSGAEVLFGIGLLCNAMQIITFGRDALQVARHIKDDHSPDPRLRQYIDQSRATYVTLSNAANSVGRTLSPEEKEIFDIGKLCNDRLDELSKQLDKVSVPENKRGGKRWLASISQGIRSIWSKSALDDLEKDLGRHQRRLQQQLLLRICTQEEAAKIQRHAGFDKIDKILQGFITQYAAGERELSKLITQGVEDTKNHVTMENNETRSLVRDGQSQQAADAAFARLLDSLAYPGMNERKNMVSENHPKTFRWAFEVPHEDFSAIRDWTSNKQGKLPGNKGNIVKEEPTKFVSWLRSDLPLFWVSGKAGSGKSTFMKFLATHPQTAKNLQSWRPNVRILCHYFWIASSDLQQNQKGMLFSLLWQTLRDDRALAQRALGNLPDLNYKGAPSDWSMRDLVETLSYAWKANISPVCLFLDGLDEAGDSPDLLEPMGGCPQSLLHQLLAMCDMKICISSREEPSLVTFFERIHDLRSLKIHELTEQDMKQFVAERFPVHPALPAEVRDRMLQQICWKADGVFLWVVVAVESLKKGLSHGDSVIILERRLEMMPPKLEELFRDMWGRLGPDTVLYEKSASLLFNLVIAANRMTKNILAPDVQGIVYISLAADDSLFKRFCTMRAAPVSKDEIQTKIRDAKRMISTHCAGILEVSYPDPENPEKPETLPGRRSNVRFAHRSAFDFITSTDIGNRIMKACGLSQDEISSRLLLAILVLACVEEDGRRSYASTSFGDQEYFPYPNTLGLRDVFCCMSMIESMTTKREIANVALKWQLGGHFSAYKSWRHPTLAQERCRSDFRLFQYLEAAVIEGPFGFVEEQLEHLHTEQFLDAVPIICRAAKGQLDTTPWEYCCKRMCSPGVLQNPRLHSVHNLTLLYVVLDMLEQCLQDRFDSRNRRRNKEDLHSRLGAAPRFMTSLCPTGEVLNMTLWLTISWRAYVGFSSPLYHIPGREHVPQLALACNPEFMTRLLTRLIGADDREWGSVADLGVVEAPLEALMLSSDKGQGFRRPRQVDKARLEHLVLRLLLGQEIPRYTELEEICIETWENGTMIGVGDWESGIGYMYDRGYFIHPWTPRWYGLRVPESGNGPGQGLPSSH